MKRMDVVLLHVHVRLDDHLHALEVHLHATDLKFRCHVVGVGVGPKWVRRGNRPHRRRKDVDKVVDGYGVVVHY